LLVSVCEVAGGFTAVSANRQEDSGAKAGTRTILHLLAGNTSGVPEEFERTNAGVVGITAWDRSSRPRGSGCCDGCASVGINSGGPH
jgi:hypothetical protein